MDIFYKIQTTEIPLQKSTIMILPYSREELFERLHRFTYTHSLHKNERLVFCGSIGKEKFRISRNTTYATTFLPVLEGHVENTSHGCIVFLHYKLFNNIKQLLFFALFFVLCVGGYFFFIADEPVNTFLCFLFISLNYAVAHANFRRQVRLTHQELMKVIES